MMTRILLCSTIVLTTITALLGTPATQPTPATHATPQSASAFAPLKFEMMPPAKPTPLKVQRDNGYNGLWFSLSPLGPFVGTRLSGGVAFYPPENQPTAIYSASADKTFFVYAGSTPFEQPTGSERLRLMISYFDHKTGTLPRPVILDDNHPKGAYGCPALSIDDKGRLYVFIAPLGTESPGQILRSTQPYDISAWEVVTKMDFRQPQPWYVPGKGFMLLHLRMIDDQPRAFFSISHDGLSWSKSQAIATFGLAQDCVSGQFRDKVGIALTYRPEGAPPDQFTNLYYLETNDLGKTWQAFPRKKLQLPLAEIDNLARVCDFDTRWRVFLQDLTFNQVGTPAILHLLCHERIKSPAPNSRMWTISRWAGRGWETATSLYSDHSLDGGALAIDKQKWYLAVPTIPGPQTNSSGGDLVRWMSEDGGRSWFPMRLSKDSTVNQNWPRHPLNASPEVDFIWADGNPRKPSGSRIYFADRQGNTYALPTRMDGETVKPERILESVTPEPATEPTPAASLPVK